MLTCSALCWRPAIAAPGASIARPMPEWVLYLQAETAGQTWRAAGFGSVVLERAPRVAGDEPECIPLLDATYFVRTFGSRRRATAALAKSLVATLRALVTAGHVDTTLQRRFFDPLVVGELAVREELSSGGEQGPRYRFTPTAQGCALIAASSC